MMKRAAGIIQGRIRAEAFGAFPETFLNALAAKGIELWNIEALDANTLRFEFHEREHAAVEELARRCSMDMSVTKSRDSGRRLVKRRLVLLPMLAFFALCLLVSSLFIWQIDIYGSHSMSRGEILRALEDSGLDTGVFWPGLKADDIRSRVMQRLPQIGWMAVNISGSRAVVLINERVDKPEIYEEGRAADLTASKTGLVRRVSVLRGNAAVEPGQAVTEGELLVSGTLHSIMGRERRVRSRGSVMADTWYEIDGVCPETMDKKSPGTFTRHRFALVFGKRRINFYISSGKAIDECDKIIKEYTLGVEGHFALPIRIVHERIVPYDSLPGQGYNRDSMAAKLGDILESTAEGQILQSAYTESMADGLYVLTLRAHCVENIAVTRELD